MRVCPGCREGYEDHVTVCPDCGIPLVAERGEPAPTPVAAQRGPLAPGPDAFLIFPFRSEEHLAEALSCLSAHGIRSDAGSINLREYELSLLGREALAVSVPTGQAREAMEVLVGEAPMTLPPQVLEEAWRELAEEAPELPASLPPELALPLPVLLERAEDLLPELVQGYLAGGRVGLRAHYVLIHGPADPEPAVLEAALTACRNGNEEDLLKLGQLLADFAGERTVNELSNLLRTASGAVRTWIARLLAGVPTLGAVGLLVMLLMDEEVGVRTEAHNALTELTGEDLGYQPRASEPERREMTAAWGRYLIEHEDDLGVEPSEADDGEYE